MDGAGTGGGGGGDDDGAQVPVARCPLPVGGDEVRAKAAKVLLGQPSSS